MITELFYNWPIRMTNDFNQAQSTIVLSTLHYVAPEKKQLTNFYHLHTALCAAGDRGLDVMVLMAQPSRRHPATSSNIRAANALADHNILTKFVPQSHLMHAKTAVIDNSILWVGSGNMTPAAAHHNFEVFTRTESTDLALEFDEWLKLVETK